MLADLKDNIKSLGVLVDVCLQLIERFTKSDSGAVVLHGSLCVCVVVSASLMCSEVVDNWAISVDVLKCASDDGVAASLIKIEHAIGCVRACGEALAFLGCLSEGVLSDDVESLEPAVAGVIKHDVGGVGVVC